MKSSQGSILKRSSFTSQASHTNVDENKVVSVVEEKTMPIVHEEDQLEIIDELAGLDTRIFNTRKEEVKADVTGTNFQYVTSI